MAVMFEPRTVRSLPTLQADAVAGDVGADHVAAGAFAAVDAALAGEEATAVGARFAHRLVAFAGFLHRNVAVGGEGDGAALAVEVRGFEAEVALGAVAATPAAVGRHRPAG